MLRGHDITLRSPIPEDAALLTEYLRTVSGECPYLMHDPDEINFTVEEEREFINSRNGSEDSVMILAFSDGEFAGSCSFESMGRCGKRYRHRMDIGISLLERFTGFGLGRLMLERLLQKAKDEGFEQAELSVVDENERAIALYRKLGFEECGHMPRCNKYEDGTYTGDIFMVKLL
ncbi:MAG: GNAT family N-acetyltransferase [Oscillospiraceae bacterium]|nr:GNAT family N-acetyltransferase [Oscillospiraceae bacterium]